MKTYIFTELELKNKIDKMQGTYHNTLDLIETDTLVAEMTEGKKPVELISSGKITMPYDDILMYPDIKPDDLAKYIGSNVNFYIEVKESKDE
jgi:hypothetical protein